MHSIKQTTKLQYVVTDSAYLAPRPTAGNATWQRQQHNLNPLIGTGNYIATPNNMKLIHWPLMGELLHLVQPTHQRPVYQLRIIRCNTIIAFGV